MIFSVNLVDGSTLPYSTSTLAARSVNISQSAFVRSFLDAPRQLGGFHWRSEGAAYWHPPDGFTFVTNYIEVGNGYVVAESSDSVRVYDSVSSASRILNIDRRQLSDAVSSGSSYNGSTWRESRSLEFTRMHNVPAPLDIRLYPITFDTPQACRKQGGKNKILSYHLVTKTVAEYNSAEQAGSKTNISPHTIKNTLLDEPRQYEGLIFYSMGASSRWDPPDFFKFNPESYVKKMDGYITSVSETGEVVAMYEGIGAAVAMEGYDRGTLRTKIGKGKVYKGCIWRAALPSEFNNFIEL